MQTTISHSYLPPTDALIQLAADNVELKIKTPDFVRDVCNIRANGRFLTAEELMQVAEKELESKPIVYQAGTQAKGKITKAKFKDPFTTAEYASYQQAKDAVFARHAKTASNIRTAIEMLPTMEVPGATPLLEAINLIKLLAEQQSQNTDANSNTDESSSISQLVNPANLSKAKQALSEAKNMSQQERTLLEKIAELKKKIEQNTENKPSAGLGGTAVASGTMVGDTATGKSILETAIRLSDKQMRNALKISRKLKSVSKLRVSKLTKFEPDVQADEVRNRSMKSYSELGKIKSSQFSSMISAPGVFKYRAATNQYMIRERGKYTEKKQLLYMLIDCSGSMVEDDGDRISLAAGVLINRLMAVADGDATLYWRFFDTKSYDVTYVTNQEDAYASINTVLNEENFTGGGTNFDVALTDAVEHIMSMKETVSFTKPEIMLVTDGACGSNFSYSNLKGVKLHTAFVSDERSHHIENLTIEAGGVVLHLAE
jgi:uncharacterized protein with von Willebrand factor type A (vWA) domain